MPDRRSDQDRGLTGSLAKRAGEWELTGYDENTMQRQKVFWNALVDYRFRMEVDGWENLSAPPVLWDAGRADDSEYVDRTYRDVHGSIQRGMDALARKRSLPLFG